MKICKNETSPASRSVLGNKIKIAESGYNVLGCSDTLIERTRQCRPENEDRIRGIV